jgi:hypothetical protein
VYATQECGVAERRSAVHSLLEIALLTRDAADRGSAELDLHLRATMLAGTQVFLRRECTDGFLDLGADVF